MLDRLTADDFSGRIGETFTFAAPDVPPFETVLTECEGSDRPFSLVFSAPGGELVPQQIVTVRHPEIGELGIFVVPLGPAEGGMRYQAVFS